MVPSPQKAGYILLLVWHGDIFTTYKGKGITKYSTSTTLL